MFGIIPNFDNKSSKTVYLRIHYQKRGVFCIPCEGEEAILELKGLAVPSNLNKISEVSI
jgi:hypothetical protein